jgi:hypothetical protein
MNMQLRGITAIALVAALVAACSSGTSTGPATMNVKLVDAPTGEYEAVNVDVQTVLIKGDGEWITLGSPNQVYDLLHLTKGISATLVEGAHISAGHYGQMRLVLGSRNTVVLPGGAVEPLKVPSGQQTGVKLLVNFDVEPGTTADVYIDFDAHKSVFVHKAGASGKYILRPTVRAYDKLETGSISGVVTDAGSAAPIAGVEVTAQAIVEGKPVVMASDFTDDAGRYVLGLLPVGGSYHVVSQPVLLDTLGAATSSWEAKASPAFPITVAAPVRTYDVAFTLATARGTATGAITTPVDPLDEITSEVDTIFATFPLDGGAGLQPFVVRTAKGVFGAGGAETWTMAGLPSSATPYVVSGQRRGIDASGDDVIVPSTTTPSVTITAGGTATADIAFPP